MSTTFVEIELSNVSAYRLTLRKVVSDSRPSFVASLSHENEVRQKPQCLWPLTDLWRQCGHLTFLTPLQEARQGALDYPGATPGLSKLGICPLLRISSIPGPGIAGSRPWWRTQYTVLADPQSLDPLLCPTMSKGMTRIKYMTALVPRYNMNLLRHTNLCPYFSPDLWHS